ncbi:hypothetical protein CBR_g57877 [Chara braunii]|uniref:Uncharacterized protein n=1 Tax=Chara braunii TaxID=69332 RepID=A0A388K8D3_CHABU|nr:hypothetical protein CBR_g57877 [Chara braunii]|eukprot:GBG66279.1 hypothetical protein CBR_g57877 [Chara braunii]
MVVTAQYDAPAYTFGARFPTRLGEDTPGPGSYAISRAKDGPAYSLSTKTYQGQGGGDQPGPGEYTIKPVRGAPAYTFGARTGPGGTGGSSSWDRAGSPGPGAYEIRPRSAGPAYSMLGKGRPPYVDYAAPGPGTYNFKKSKFVHLSAPAYTFGGKLNAES